MIGIATAQFAGHGMPQVVRVVDTLRQRNRLAFDFMVWNLTQQMMDAVEARLLLVHCLDNPPSGFGNVGANAARLMQSAGYKIVGVSRSVEALYNSAGIDIAALWLHYERNQTFEGYAGAEPTDPAEVPFLDCEIFIPAAVENQITSRNAANLKARILCEGANGPTTAEADSILADKKIFVIPDILANSGGVTVSYFEWVQDRQGYFWLESEVNHQLGSLMRAAFDAVLSYAETHSVSNRIAAYMLAIDRVAYTLRQRGIYA